MQAVWDYLTFRYVPQPESIWQNIYKLPPGHYLTFSARDKAPHIERYWDIPYTDSVPNLAPQEYQRQFEDLFLSAVRYHLIADVPVGVLLSGGIDSSAVAAAISEVHNGRLDSFSVAFKDSPGTDELRYARMVAKHTGTNHHEVVIGKHEFLDFLPHLVRYTDEPLADLAAVPLHYVSQLARRHVKVVLSGEGSDEILGGYSFERMQKIWDGLRRLINLPAGIRSLASEIARPFLPSQQADKLDWLSQPPEEWLRNTPFNMTHLFTETENHELFGSTNSFNPSLNKVLEDTRRASSDLPLHQALYTYCQSWLVEDLLMKADKMTMANSIELRVPFLDYRLVNWAAQSPIWVKVGGGPAGMYESKWVLRRFAEKRLPIEIITRPKQGFPVPVYDWLDAQIKDWAWATLSANAKLNELMDNKALHVYLERGTRSEASVGERHRLWLLLILELWLQAWQTK
jgi:asparagine synthase (glutamine-hydrolysing)